jgi:acylphosphatase
MRSVAIEVYGRVQGVWFRKYTRDQATDFDLKGFVKNRPDGSVYIEATGKDEMIEGLIKWCHSGSPLSFVENVVVHELEKEHLIPFTIKS